MKKQMTIPNALTLLRMAGAVCLLFVAPLSTAFYVIYTISGASDVLDGWIARATKTTSDFGARLDSVADLVFYGVMLIRIFPLLWVQLPIQIWYWVAGILLLRVCSYGTAAAKYHRLASLHTYLNKLTGLMVFLIPYLMGQSCTTGFCMAVCAVATLATVEELLLHICSASYCHEVKSLLQCHPRRAE